VTPAARNISASEVSCADSLLASTTAISIVSITVSTTVSANRTSPPPPVASVPSGVALNYSFLFLPSTVAEYHVSRCACAVLQRVVACCSVLQYGLVCVPACCIVFTIGSGGIPRCDPEVCLCWRFACVVLQRVAACFSVLSVWQRVAVSLPSTAAEYRVSRCVCVVLRRVALCCSMLQCVSVCDSSLHCL